MDFEYSALRRKLKIMEKFKTKEYLDELDRMGVNYTVDNNPSPEDIERIKKIINTRCRAEAIPTCFGNRVQK